jgi:phage terminase large subunit-like protein
MTLVIEIDIEIQRGIKMKNSKDDIIKNIKNRILQESHLRQKELSNYDWGRHARDEQKLPLGDWKIWLILAGRGFGKTRTGAESVRSWIQNKQARRIALVGDTQQDVRRVMLEGDSGLLGIHPPDERPLYFPSRGLVSWKNGATATLYSSEKHETLRGPQFDAAWVDELAKFRAPRKTWDQLMFALRKGACPRVIITTTPRPCSLLKELLERQGKDVVVTKGSTFDNADHLAPSFIQTMSERYAQTRLGAQELYGEILEDDSQALWSSSLLKSCYRQEIPPLTRLVVALDPAVTNHAHSDETGIIVAGRDAQNRAFILTDLSGKYRPQEWAQKALSAYHHFQADRIIAEVNQGGDLVEQMLRSLDQNVAYKAVRATRDKLTRAEPVAALYAQGRVFHTGKNLGNLERQLCTYIPGNPSPDRLDALVWAVTDLLLSHKNPPPKNFWMAK